MKKLWYSLTGVLVLAVLAGCSGVSLNPNIGQAAGNPTADVPIQAPAITQAAAAPTGAAESTPETPAETSPAVSPTAAGQQPGTQAPAGGDPTPAPPQATLAPDAWKDLPVVPVVGEAPARIYQHGLELGNNPHAFSKVGDCGSTPTWFLGDFDRGPRFYRLGPHAGLEGVIQQFQGSYGRTSLAARAGFNASSVFTALWANREFCDSNESPLACEYRLNRPAVAFIMLGTNDVWHLDVFEPQMRQIIEYSIEQGVIPILTTKADNQEGDHSVNATIARLAQEYDLPLWNYWRAVQDLPNGGLQEDGAHLTWAGNRFDDPNALQTGWTVRNLTALQTLDAVWAKISTAPAAQ